MQLWTTALEATINKIRTGWMTKVISDISPRHILIQTSDPDKRYEGILRSKTLEDFGWVSSGKG